MIALVATKLGWSEEKAATVIAAFLKSAWITFVAMALGLSVDAVSQGNTTPGALWTYFQAHWFAWAITNIAAPALRGIEAAHSMQTPVKE